MAYKFFTPDKSNIQKENAYIVYMMLSSYFHKAFCQNSELVTQLYMYYNAMTPPKQEARERIILRQLDKALHQVEDILERENCQVIIRKQGDNYILYFYTGFQNLRVTVIKNGAFLIEVA